MYRLSPGQGVESVEVHEVKGVRGESEQNYGGEVIKMARNTHHIVHNANGGWDVKRSRAQRSSGHFDTKADAVKAGRIISRNQGTEFIIHGINGKIQSSDSHGNDPFPPRG